MCDCRMCLGSNRAESAPVLEPDRRSLPLATPHQGRHPQATVRSQAALHGSDRLASCQADAVWDSHPRAATSGQNKS